MIESADGVEEDDEKRFIRFAPNFSEKKREKMTGFVLCVDAQSFPEWFGFSKLWSIKNLTEKIEEFVKVAKKIDLKLFVFLDAGKSSQNSLDTWFLRTEEKILREAQDCAPSLQMLVGEIFQSLGVQVYFSTSVIDHNDAIASFAHWNKGHILSLKKLFFEYKGSNYIVYNSLRVNEQGMMTLFKRKDFVRHKKRKLLISDFVQHMGTSMPNFEETKEKKTYSRGMGSSLIKYTGNPHAKIVALRQALYGIMFANNTNVQIVEYVPEWYQNSVLWVKKIVQPTFETHYFAKTIDQLYKEFFGDHIFNFHLIDFRKSLQTFSERT